ncbi:AIM24 family protein [Streptomyces europaeiscabiei]|uniref:AIM24 family protein n=1 Tax=Streptomyces europaeiscabiei TaxID=146819 RepID=A0ABU4NDF2_9ACTN|nr:AIM24 family protein [Streptomyces europaeiscabiei]MDX2526433.1 AIM24 family protein [Streptomyces europaeiscabiei]MDX2758294.1 AIM24 family protein [Streptomyces europaeiscabiei]MDX2767886.1 AIM24 family protein [Streptomyces europaeiscabiei]MDX3544023.1 AIM24 family protein [Streptomyces europaeiscabiei]MDX3552257.1 AIM24 family protein [Streptomyces europaeiscabiei]
MKSDLFSNENMVQPAYAPGMSVQNAKSIKYAVNGEMLARQGAMIAYRGNLQFERKGQGVGGMLKRAVTGEGLALMAVRGQGEAWFAHEAQNCFVVDIEPGDVFTVNGRNVLCFDASLSYEIKTVKGAGMTGGGLFNSVFTGQGKLGLVCDGNPLVIPVSPQQPVFVDTDAVVGWTAHLNTSLHRSQSFGSMMRGGSGEAVQLKLEGEGFVVVRPSELTPQKAQQH